MMAKKKSRGKRERQSSAAKIRNGLKAFLDGNYDKAIEIWERVGQRSGKKRLTILLAQAHFRRGLERVYGDSLSLQAGLTDLERAHDLQPDDPCYALHLGLAAHRQGDLDRAAQAYRIAYESDGEFARRAAYPLAVALAQQGKELPPDMDGLPLSDAERLLLDEAPAFNRRPYDLSPAAPLLWQGLAALDTGDEERARAVLEATKEDPPSRAAAQVAHYYLGVLEAGDENWEGAVRYMNTALASGMATSRLRDNLGELYHRLAEERLENGAPRDALAAANEAMRHKTRSNSLDELVSQAHQQLAHAAASAGDWLTALEHWKAAEEAEGGSFRLAYNMALAHERLENFVMAGERWREALRRKPRRDDHPDALTDEQVSQLWRRCSDAYSKGGEYEESVRVCRHAVKWNPEHVDTRMALAEVLLSNGQLQAAENELRRILQRDSDYVPALLRMGEVISAHGRWWSWESPVTFWDRVLELEPGNVAARQLAADYYQDQAEYEMYWRNYDAAIEAYEQALNYLPENAALLATVGGFYLRLGRKKAALAHFEQALAKPSVDLGVYDKIIHAWLDVGESERAWTVLDRAEAAIDEIPYEFYFTQGYHCCAGPNEDLAQPWLERAVELAPPDLPIFALIGEMAVSTEAWIVAREYLERALAENQVVGQSHLLMGIVASHEEDRDAAEKHWREAERIARRERDQDLLERIKMTRFHYSGPPGLASLLMRMGYSLDDFDLDDDDDF